MITEQSRPRKSKPIFANQGNDLKHCEGTWIKATVILRPGCVYNPGGPYWTERRLKLMRRGKLIAVKGGTEIALLHVGDVSVLMLLTL